MPGENCKIAVTEPLMKISERDYDCLICPQLLSVSGQMICNNRVCNGYCNFNQHINGYPLRTMSLSALYAEQEGVNHDSAIALLTNKLNINTSVPFEYEGNNNSGWNQVKNINPFNCSNPVAGYPIYFMGERSNLLGYADIYQSEPGKKVVVTYTAWSYKSGQELFWLPIPFEKPYPLLNWNYIHSNPNAEIWLSDSVELAYYLTRLNQDMHRIFTAWLGGEETIDDVDWNILKGRRVIIMLQRHSGLPDKEIHRVALKTLLQLKKVHGVLISFCPHFNLPG